MAAANPIRQTGMIASMDSRPPTSLSSDAAPDSGRVKSADRALAIFEVFKETQRPMSAKEIAEIMAMPRSSTNVLLRSLISAGYLQFDGDTSRYFPTLKIVNLGDWLFEGRTENPAGLAVMRDINELSRETVTLSMRHGYKARFLYIFDSTFPIALNVRPGDGAVVFEAAVGIAILAGSSNQEVLDLAERYNRSSESRGARVDTTKLMDEVEQVRRTHLSIGYDRWAPDAGAIGVPIDASVFGAPTAIAIGGPSFRIRKREKELTDLVLKLTAPLRTGAATGSGGQPAGTTRHV